jgi:hypothetical protein
MNIKFDNSWSIHFSIRISSSQYHRAFRIVCERISSDSIQNHSPWISVLLQTTTNHGHGLDRIDASSASDKHKSNWWLCTNAFTTACFLAMSLSIRSRVPWSTQNSPVPPKFGTLRNVNLEMCSTKKPQISRPGVSFTDASRQRHTSSSRDGKRVFKPLLRRPPQRPPQLRRPLLR